MIALLTE